MTKAIEFTNRKEASAAGYSGVASLGASLTRLQRWSSLGLLPMGLVGRSPVFREDMARELIAEGDLVPDGWVPYQDLRKNGYMIPVKQMSHYNPKGLVRTKLCLVEGRQSIFVDPISHQSYLDRTTKPKAPRAAKVEGGVFTKIALEDRLDRIERKLDAILAAASLS